MQALLQAKGLNYVLDIVGGSHKYQMRTLYIIMLHHLFRSFFIMYYPFLTQTPVFSCKDPNNPDQYIDCYENNGGCAAKILSPNSPNSLVVDLGFYCEKAYVRTVASMLFFAGGNIGAAYVAYLSDNKGRKYAMTASYFVTAIFTILLGAASIGPLTYCLFLMLTWAGSFFYCSMSLTYIAEVSDEKFGKNGTLAVLLSIVAAEIILVGIAYLISSWRIVLIFCVGVPYLFTMFSFRYLLETPAYFYGKKKFQEAVQILKEIAHVNGKSSAVTDFIPPSPQTNASDEQISAISTADSQTKKSYNYVQIIVHPKLRLRVITFTVIKTYLFVAFFGSLFALSSLGGNIYVNALVCPIAEALGYFLYYKMKHLPVLLLLKRSLQVIVLTGVSFLLIPTLSCNSFFMCRPLFLQGFLALVMRAALCFIYGFIYSLGNELFPIEVRCQSIGISDIAASMGGMFAPVVILVAETYGLNALFLFGSLGFIALFASHFLPKDPMHSLEDPDEGVEMKYIKMADPETV